MAGFGYARVWFFRRSHGLAFTDISGIGVAGNARCGYQICKILAVSKYFSFAADVC